MAKPPRNCFSSLKQALLLLHSSFHFPRTERPEICLRQPNKTKRIPDFCSAGTPKASQSRIIAPSPGQAQGRSVSAPRLGQGRPLCRFLDLGKESLLKDMTSEWNLGQWLLKTAKLRGLRWRGRNSLALLSISAPISRSQGSRATVLCKGAVDHSIQRNATTETLAEFP